MQRQRQRHWEIEKERVKRERPDGVVGPHADPVRDGPILPHLLRQLLLYSECLVRRLQQQLQQQPNQSNQIKPKP